jgi:hypothetical protein
MATSTTRPIVASSLRVGIPMTIPSLGNNTGEETVSKAGKAELGIKHT